MKPLLIILFSILFVSNLPGQFSTANVIGQTADSLGLDNNSTLNRQESILLNTLLKNSRDTFDFTNKKIVFVTGSSGNRLNSKSNFFKNHVKPWIDKGSTPSISFVQLPSDDKLNTGFDALVLSWVKLFTDKQKRKIIGQLKQQRKSGER